MLPSLDKLRLNAPVSDDDGWDIDGLEEEDSGGEKKSAKEVLKAIHKKHSEEAAAKAEKPSKAEKPYESDDLDDDSDDGDSPEPAMAGPSEWWKTRMELKRAEENKRPTDNKRHDKRDRNDEWDRRLEEANANVRRRGEEVAAEKAAKVEEQKQKEWERREGERVGPKALVPDAKELENLAKDEGLRTNSLPR